MPTWFVLADGKHARIYERLTASAPLKPVPDGQFDAEDAHGFARDLGTDRPGRAFDTGSGARHAMEPHTDPHARSKSEFAARVARVVDAAVAARRCGHVVLVAPPHMLGELRTMLSAATRDRVIASAGKDLIKIPPDQLATHLDIILAERRFGI